MSTKYPAKESLLATALNEATGNPTPRDSEQRAQVTENPVKMPVIYPEPDEWFRLTGTMQSRRCISVQVRDKDSDEPDIWLSPVSEPALRVIHPWTSEIIYHEAITETGKRFGFPQLIGDNPQTPCRCHGDQERVFDAPSGKWFALKYCSNCDAWEYFTKETDDRAQIEEADFNQLLTASLRSITIDCIDHPVVKRLLASGERKDDEDFVLEWVENG